MDESSLTAELLPTPFISSFIGRARAGDVSDADPARRAGAWAHWAISNLSKMKGASEREYTALVLPGRFYDPKGKISNLRPHLEIPSHVLEKADPDFPDRLAQIGNGLNFAWWIMTEVTAVRRALFNHPSGSISEVVHVLNERRVALMDALTEVSKTAAGSWSILEEKLFSEEDNLSGDAAGDFSTEEIADFFPPATDLKLKIVYDTRLRESNQRWASRRVGVWQITGVHDGAHFALGVITPRLTANSLFKDALFSPQKESAAALLVRSLLLRRLVKNHIGPVAPGHVIPSVSVKLPGAPYLRAIVAKSGAKMPQASAEACVHFLRSYPDAENAWTVLNRWASSTYLLTVSKEGFMAAHKNALRFMRRSEDPSRDDIDLILPLAWDQGPSPRVVRVTFSRPQAEETKTTPTS